MPVLIQSAKLRQVTSAWSPTGREFELPSAFLSFRIRLQRVRNLLFAYTGLVQEVALGSAFRPSRQFPRLIAECSWPPIPQV